LHFIFEFSFFKPNGKLLTVVEMTNKILRQTEQIKGTDHRVDITNNTFAKEIKP
jgi:hypothetical protein